MTDSWQTGAERRPSPDAPANSRAPRSGLPSRTELLSAITTALEATGQPWAWQGEADAAERWAADTGPKDLDIWYAAPPAAGDPVDLLTDTYAGARVAEAHDPRRLRHVSLSIETSTGPAVVDVTYGDLRVGPVLLMPVGQVTTDPASHRLTGAAATADLLIRPVLRGRLPGGERLAEARAAWVAADSAHRRELARRLSWQLGPRVAAELVAVAGGAAPDPRLPLRARMRLVALSLTPKAVGATWNQRRSVLPAAKAAGPLGLRVRGVVVALVGTDGSGKSTVADGLHERLHQFGLPTSATYFGMARGNLPGVALARRLLNVGSTAPTGAASDHAAAPIDPAADHGTLRRVAAWFYAGEYVWRYLRNVAPAVAARRVVIADRWVYDLRESPWPGSRAARVAEFVVPAPDILVLPDAPAELIHERKPERTLAEQADQQQRFRELLAERPARHAEIVVDTSGATEDPLAPLVAAVVQAAHGPRRRPR
ncbi:thymidylate kinase [Actinoplanes sp. NPDC051859]|uniref:thymidylate kinase n=1 Tax=Actinoplanes sp. NPDC051859 TaxID=3363909 RepID=UPI00379A737C